MTEQQDSSSLLLLRSLTSGVSQTQDGNAVQPLSINILPPGFNSTASMGIVNVSAPPSSSPLVALVNPTSHNVPVHVHQPAPALLSQVNQQLPHMPSMPVGNPLSVFQQPHLAMSAPQSSPSARRSEAMVLNHNFSRGSVPQGLAMGMAGSMLPSQNPFAAASVSDASLFRDASAALQQQSLFQQQALNLTNLGLTVMPSTLSVAPSAPVFDTILPGSAGRHTEFDAKTPQSLPGWNVGVAASPAQAASMDHPAGEASEEAGSPSEQDSPQAKRSGGGAGRGGAQSKRCEHNRQKNKCKECRGAGICEHNRLRRMCRLCKGTGICQHNRQWSICTECKGSQICEHLSRRSRCKLCGGAQICEHGRRRSRCKDCGGPEICEHQRERRLCKDCGGSGICVHLRQRRFCRECKNKPPTQAAAARGGSARAASAADAASRASSASSELASPPSSQSLSAAPALSRAGGRVQALGGRSQGGGTDEGD